MQQQVRGKMGAALWGCRFQHGRVSGHKEGND
jgi:hypothetical protein